MKNQLYHSLIQKLKNSILFVKDMHENVIYKIDPHKTEHHITDLGGVCFTIFHLMHIVQKLSVLLTVYDIEIERLDITNKMFYLALCTFIVSALL